MTSKITYLDNLRCESVHLQSGDRITTDAPTDNHGKGEAFSPTDLCATSLAQCMLTTLAILGADKGISMTGAYAEVQKNMISNPRKIGEIVCELHLKGSFSEEQKKFIEETALNCPVALSLHPDLKKVVTFHYSL